MARRREIARRQGTSIVCGRCRRRCRVERNQTRRGGAGGGVGAIVEAAENHFSSRGLVYRRDHDVHTAIDGTASAIDDDHRAIVEVGDSLAGFLPFPQNEHTQGFAGENGGFTALASSLTLRMERPWTRATLLRLKSLVARQVSHVLGRPLAGRKTARGGAHEAQER